MGGLFGRAEEWERFSDRWQKALREDPSIPYFKMREAVHRKGAFASLSEAQSRAKLVRLVEVLNGEDFEFDALHITVDTAAYARAVDGVRGVGSHPYFFTFHMFVNAACMALIDRGEREPCEIFF